VTGRLTLQDAMGFRAQVCVREREQGIECLAAPVPACSKQFRGVSILLHPKGSHDAVTYDAVEVTGRPAFCLLTLASRFMKGVFAVTRLRLYVAKYFNRFL
jgi:hypothetical protein